ncbi:TPA: AraC family transcriptional regulator, partial [Klebsiella quasipneumoniae]|nr:AraC family transcriptional regulator [Klebsiella quasipneumoniae]
YAAARQNELNVEINAFVGCHEARKPSSTLTARSGLYVGVDFYGSWSRYARLSSDLYLDLLPTLGVSRRDGYDIECFMARHTEGGDTEERCYHVRYFIPVTLKAAAQQPGSDNESVPARGTQ